MSELYTSSEAREILKVSTSTFKSYVDSGQIRKITPPGKRQGKYLKEDVDRMAQAKKQFATTHLERQPIKKKSEEVEIESETDWVKADDLPYLLTLDYEMYGIEETVDISITHAWWEKNPHMCRVLFNKENRKDIWGYITLMPMKEEIIFKLLRREIHERDIRPDDILTYETGKEYHVYATSAVIRPEHRKHLRKLIQSVLDYWCYRYPEIALSKIYAYADSNEGWDLIKHLFFAPRYDIGKSAFELNPFERNPSRLIAAFQECVGMREEAKQKT